MAASLSAVSWDYFVSGAQAGVSVEHWGRLLLLATYFMWPSFSDNSPPHTGPGKANAMATRAPRPLICYARIGREHAARRNAETVVLHMKKFHSENPMLVIAARRSSQPRPHRRAP